MTPVLSCWPGVAWEAGQVRRHVPPRAASHARVRDPGCGDAALYNNARINDLRALLTARMNDLRNGVDRRLASVEAKIDLLTGKIVELGNRLTRVEAHLGIK